MRISASTWWRAHDLWLSPCEAATMCESVPKCAIS
jgi:hypothetical protein